MFGSMGNSRLRCGRSLDTVTCCVVSEPLSCCDNIVVGLPIFASMSGHDNNNNDDNNNYDDDDDDNDD